jgi:ubiquinone/menaquinone biosynthesis C-methylase UbiE
MPETKGWGIVETDGAELWDALPVIARQNKWAWFRLLFYPKKFVLYRHIQKKYKPGITILDVGCGTGAAVIEMKKLFPDAEIAGIDVVQLQVDIARERLKTYATSAQIELYDGSVIPAADNSVDVVYTSDVLGHVRDVTHWLREMHRVLKPGGALAMFSESQLGRHAYIRNFLYKRGVNVDPHKEFHISLFSKSELRQMLNDTGFVIERMYSTVWAKFLVHPDELYPALQSSTAFPILKFLNKILYRIKMKTRPFSLAVAELYSLVELYTLGRWVESQGYIIIGKKKN